MTVSAGPQVAPPRVRLRDLHPALQLRLAIAFVERTLNTMVIPLVAIYLSARLGASRAGLLILTSVVVAVVAGLSSGHFADRLGRRRALLVGAAAMTVGFGGMAMAATPWWSSSLTLFAFYLLQMAAASFIQPVHDAVIIDVTVPAERTVVYTINYWSFNLAIAAGALLAGFLYEGHFGTLLVGGSVCMLAATVLTFRFLEETAPPAVSRSEAAGPRPLRGGAVRDVARGYLLAFTDRRFMALLAAFTLVLGLELQRTSGFVAVRVAHDVPTQDILPFASWLPAVTGVQLLGILHAANTVCVVVLALVAERLLRRLSDRRRVAAGVALFTAACAVLALSDLAWVLLLAVLVLTIGELMHIPVMQTVLADVVPEHSRAKYMAVFNLNVRGGMVIAALCLSLGGFVPAWGMAWLYVLLGLAAALLYRSLLTARKAAP